MTVVPDLDPATLRLLTVGELRARFAGLPEPETGALVGRWDGALVGRPSVVRRSRRLAAVTPLRHWCGKRFVDAHHVVNLLATDGTVRDGPAGEVVLGSSRLDGRPAAVVVYRHTMHGPWRGLRGELRLMPTGELLGMLLVHAGPLRLGPFPFLLRRAD